MTNALILIATVAALGLLLMPRVLGSQLFRATVTPLASIIGSGFLVLGPILDSAYGLWAPLVMGLLCLLAWVFGAAVRHNIAALDGQGGWPGRAARRIEQVSSWALAFAYFISVAYYLNLFGAFAVSLTDLSDPVHARQVTSGVLLVILLVGWTSGFGALERMEQVTVSIKLAIILGLLVGLVIYFTGQAQAGALVLNPAHQTGWSALTLGFGLIVTVQGFETSRYLGDEYDGAMRIRSMRLAQIVATAIYMIYIGLLAYAFPTGRMELNETAIIDLMAVVAPILPVLLVAAALAAQFSAAVADTAGSGGLIHELTGGRIRPRVAYAVLVGFGLLLTWVSDVFQIIAYASRAFAAYYALQAVLAALAARGGRRAAFLVLAALGAAIAILGVPVE
ncbi:hypothetical protein LA6_003909 [Marinibacterium anthonyi]|nr:hypothetical protein LA6_003909 [Marinibacterium anthonyi]